MKKVMLAAFCAAALSSCQSNFTYVPIVANPPNMEMAEAQCQMMSSGTQQGMVAWGNANYVAGAQLGNAIGNAIRADQFVQQCMTMSGWRRVKIPSDAQVKASIPPRYAKAAAKARSIQGKGPFPTAPSK